MDLLNLGSQSRKTGLKPRQNLTKDKYDMEDIDEFFADDDDNTIRIKQQQVSGSSHSRRTIYGQSSTPKDNFDIVARRINFTDAEASSTYNLSPPIPSASKNVIPKKNKKSPLRSPLPVHKASREQRSNTLFVADEASDENEENDYNDFNDIGGNDIEDDAQSMYSKRSIDDDHSRFSPVPVLPVFGTSTKSGKNSRKPSVSSSRKGSISTTANRESLSNRKASQATPKSSKYPSSKTNTSKLTKNMALGKGASKPSTKTAIAYRAPVIDSDSDIDTSHVLDDSTELPSPPPTTKRSHTSPSTAKSSTITRTVKPSPLPSPPPDGLRRSRRTRVAPMAFWRNEKVVYKRAEDGSDDPNTTLGSDIKNIPLQEIDVLVYTEEQNNNGKTATASRKRSRSKSRKTPPKSKKLAKADDDQYDYHSDPELTGSEWFADNVLEADVFENEKEVRRVVAYTADVETQKSGDKSDQNFRMAMLYRHDDGSSASGLLDFDIGGIKRFKTSGDHVYSFHVAYGLLEVTLNNTKFVVTRGCSFQVPERNSYGLQNLGAAPARLFFVQCKIPRTEEDLGESDDEW
ncbi:Mif2/CENP-C like-domain-containing protein [Scheffersomyces xylosifermentans]|uniref:Mif2/CENP-C like-domain-containing protein n=1 Tax=Scheffersomyces xylosifermentans TaxID=1304137 RepID=UPI00315D777E